MPRDSARAATEVNHEPWGRGLDDLTEQFQEGRGWGGTVGVIACGEPIPRVAGAVSVRPWVVRRGRHHGLLRIPAPEPVRDRLQPPPALESMGTLTGLPGQRSCRACGLPRSGLRLTIPLAIVLIKQR
jgi:hypothetical protein